MKKEWKSPEVLELGVEKTEKGNLPAGNLDHAEWNPDEGRWEAYHS